MASLTYHLIVKLFCCSASLSKTYLDRNHMENLNLLKDYAIAKGFEVELINDFLLFTNVINPGNNFKLVKVSDYYLLITICVSRQDYEYSAKCDLYVLLTEYNKSNSTSTHNHIDFKVQL